MKNIHILPTDKPSRLYYNNNDKQFQLCKFEKISTVLKSNQNIYITSDEEIKEGDWVCNEEVVFQRISTINLNIKCKKIILTTDQDLIKDGVQAIDDEFLEWFVKNPSCEDVEVESKVIKDGVWTDLKGYVELPTTHSIIHKIIIPKEEPKQILGVDFEMSIDDEGMSIEIPITKQETLEQVAEKYVNGRCTGGIMERALLSAIEFGAKWQQERMYSEEEVKDLLTKFHIVTDGTKKFEDEWFEQFKKK